MAARMSDQWPPRPPQDAEPPRRDRGSPERGATGDPRNVPPAQTAPRARAGDPGPESDPAAPRHAADERPSANRKALVITVAAVVALLLIVALASGRVAAPGAPTFPPIGATTAPAGPAAASTRATLADALGAQGLQLEDVVTAYRPAEAPRVAVAPRLVVRVIVPSDPDHGRILIYEFRDTGAATVAAQEQAGYVSSGVGRVQFPPQTQFTLRVVGSTVVFYAYSTEDVPDPDSASGIATALAGLGFEVPVPN